MNFFRKKIKKVSIGSLILIVLCSTLPPVEIFAQQDQCQGVVGASGTCYAQGTLINASICRDLGGGWIARESACRASDGTIIDLIGTTGTDGQVDNVRASEGGGNVSFCNIWIVGGICNLVLTLIMAPVGLASFLLFLAGAFLDFILKFTVVDMARNVGDLSGINVAWGVIRDLVNLSFIFILLYAAIKTILGDNGLIKRTIVGVVIAAILVNFSLFFAKIIIDASNLTALTFHNAIVSSCGSGAINASSTTQSLSTCFMNPMGLTTIYNPSDQDNFLTSLGNNFWKALVISAGSTIFILITTFVFLAVGIMFLMRFVSIIILFILSPIAVMGALIPQLQAQTKKWWSNITDQALFAPAFMLMSWVTLTILYSPGFKFPGSMIANVFDGNKAGSMQIIFSFAVAIALIIATLTISKSFSKTGGSMGGTFAGKVIGGVGGYAARRTIGARARKVADSKDLKDRAKRGDIGARLQLRAAQGLARSSFDVRGALKGNIGKTLGAGKASGKGGYDQYIKDEAKKEKEFADSLGPTDIEKDKAKIDRKRAMDDFKEARDRGDLNASREAWSRVTAADEILGVNKEDVEERRKDLEKEQKKQYEPEEKSFKKAEEEETRLTKELKEKQEELEKAKLDETKDIIKGQIDVIESELKKSKKAKEEAEKIFNEKKTVTDSSYKQQKAAIEKEDDLGTVRKKAYANAITEDRWINRSLLGLGPIKRSNFQAAADMRKGKKSVKEQLEEIVQENEGGGKDKGKKDGKEEEKEGEEDKGEEKK